MKFKKKKRLVLHFHYLALVMQAWLAAFKRSDPIGLHSTTEKSL